ncbi:hypothetical protein ACOME3_000704 [Neoechinorhynchus agilis]
MDHAKWTHPQARPTPKENFLVRAKDAVQRDQQRHEYDEEKVKEEVTDEEDRRIKKSERQLEKADLLVRLDECKSQPEAPEPGETKG